MPEHSEILSKVGIVVIGRNEGQRLKTCLESLVSMPSRLVYVDSGSVDGSVALARGMGVEAVELDTSAPFSAARARNAGVQRLRETDPGLPFVQFVDADCEIIDGWLRVALTTLLGRPEIAIVAGWLRERAPEASVYNRIGNIEWSAAGAGEVDSVGGIFMIRCGAFDQAAGFDPSVPAGEEPEFCQRLIRHGWRILRLDRDMAWHDLAMTRFGQWWRRMMRSGYGSMDVAYRFGVARFVRTNLRVRLWTGWLALALGAAAGALAGSGAFAVLAVLLLGIWPVQVLRVALRTWRRGNPLGTSMAYATLVMISFLPQIAGQAMYFSDRLRNRSARLVEYKVPRSRGCERRG